MARCLAKGHLAAQCSDTDRRRCCRRFGAEGHFVVSGSATIEEAKEFPEKLKATASGHGSKQKNVQPSTTP